MFAAEYYSGVYSRPLTLIPNCFQNSLECYEKTPSKLSFKLKLNQAWDTYNRVANEQEYISIGLYAHPHNEEENAELIYVTNMAGLDEES
jgi:hypothetical protein